MEHNTISVKGFYMIAIYISSIMHRNTKILQEQANQNKVKPEEDF